MQRYRINYNWLIGFFVTSFVIAVSAYFVWSWQVNRKAGSFLVRAEGSLEEENPLEAFDSYAKYLQLRPEEDDARIKMAYAAIEVVKDVDLPMETRGKALGSLEEAVRRTDDPKLRLELAKIVIGFRPQSAIGHLEDLLADNPKDSEANSMLVRALYTAKDYDRVKQLSFDLIGYDKKSDAFDSEKATLEGESDVYAMLAEILQKRDKETELAGRVITQMVEANPESPQAHLRQSLFLASTDEEASKAALNKAYELDPKDAAILRRIGMVALNDSNIAETKDDDQELATKKAEEAREYFATGLKEHPDDVTFYQLMAQAEQRMEQTDAALKILDDGILKFDKNRSIDLVIYKIDLLLAQEDYAGVEREIKRLSQLSRPDLQPVIDFQEARMLVSKQLWADAARELKKVRPLLLNRPKFQLMAGTMLGFAYERQGIYDLALEAYNTVLDEYPKHMGAQQGRERMLARQQPKDGGIDLDEIVDKTLALPDAEQDWDAVDKLVEEVIAKNELTSAKAKLLKAKVLIKRGLLEEAKSLIRQAAKEEPDDINVQYAAILLVLSDPDQGPDPALKLLDRLEKRWGRTIRSRLQRADILAAKNAEDIVEQLRSLAADTEGLTESEVLQLEKSVGLKFEQLGKLDEAQFFYRKAAAQEAGNLPLRMHLFGLYLRARDIKGMEEAQQLILEIVKSKNDASYLLTEVKKRILQSSLGNVQPEELAECRQLLDIALLQRPKWHELHVTYGQLILLLGGDIELALEHFDEALDNGPAKSNAVLIQTKLLYERGLFKKARERMELLGTRVRGQLLGKLEAEILLKTGDDTAGYRAAKRIADARPKDATVQEWFSKIAQRVDKLDVAEEALRQSLAAVPSAPDNWVRLVGLCIEQKKFKEVEDVVRDAHLACEAEYLPMLTAKYDELLSRWQNAETIYLASYAGQEDNIAISRRMADFYLLWAKKDEANLGKAAVYINRILKAANEGRAEPSDPHVVWARQKAARILFAEQDYQQSLKAERLLRQSAVDDAMSVEESNLLADILISRGDPQSLLAAEKVLSQLRERDQLATKGALQLARLLDRTGQWDDAETLIRDLIAANPKDASIRTAYIDLLIDRDEFKRAERNLANLRDLDAKNPSIIPLSARLAAERGDQAQLVQMLNSIAPKRGGRMTEAQLKTTLSVANLATQYGAYELAEELYRTYTQRKPEEIFELARFLAYHGDCDEALQIMKRLFDDRADDVVQLANRMIADRRAEIGDKYDAEVDRLIDRALREDEDSVMRQLARAEAYENQGKNDQSIATYEKLLRRDDIPTRLRAMAMNNLGFQLGLLNQRVDEAEVLINDAMETFGPVEDMLDTRAVVRIAQEKYDLAIEDMELALTVSNDPVKFFHLAKAYALAGNGQEALKAWEQAKKNGFKKESLPQLEKPSFEDTLQKIESLQTQNAQL